MWGGGGHTGAPPTADPSAARCTTSLQMVAAGRLCLFLMTPDEDSSNRHVCLLAGLKMKMVTVLLLLLVSVTVCAAHGQKADRPHGNQGLDFEIHSVTSSEGFGALCVFYMQS